MENQQGTVGSLFEHAGDFLETKIGLVKLQAVSKTSDVAGSLVSRIAIVVVVCFAIFIFNIGLALWIGEAIGKTFVGFFIVAGFYLLVALLIHIFKKTWIKDPITNALIKKILN